MRPLLLSLHTRPCALTRRVADLETIVRILSPLLWGRIYSLGTRLGRPSFFYYVAAAAGLVQLGLLGLLRRSPDPRATQAKPQRSRSWQRSRSRSRSRTWSLAEAPTWGDGP